MSIYFMIYLLLNACLWLPLELFRPGYWLVLIVPCIDGEDEFEYALWYGKTLLILTICIAYSILSPLVWIIGLLYFSMAYFVFKYQLTCCCINQFETGSKIFPTVYSKGNIHTFFILFYFIVCVQKQKIK